MCRICDAERREAADKIEIRQRTHMARRNTQVLGE